MSTLQGQTFGFQLEGYGPKARIRAQTFQYMAPFSSAEFRPTRFTIPHYTRTFTEYKNNKCILSVKKSGNSWVNSEITFATANYSSGVTLAADLTSLVAAALSTPGDVNPDWGLFAYIPGTGTLNVTLKPNYGIQFPAQLNLQNPIYTKCLETLGIDPTEQIATQQLLNLTGSNQFYTLAGVLKLNALETLHLMSNLDSNINSNNPNLNKRVIATTTATGSYGSTIYWENGRTHYAPFIVYLGTMSALEVWVVDQNGDIIDIPINTKWSVEFTCTVVKQ